MAQDKAEDKCVLSQFRHTRLFPKEVDGLFLLQDVPVSSCDVLRRLTRELNKFINNTLKAFECGIPTRGGTWMQFRIGYYLFAILFLMFDVETMFLFPWAVVMKDLGSMGLAVVGFFLFVLVLGLAYAWRKGALKWE